MIMKTEIEYTTTMEFAFKVRASSENVSEEELRNLVRAEVSRAIANAVMAIDVKVGVADKAKDEFYTYSFKAEAFGM